MLWFQALWGKFFFNNLYYNWHNVWLYSANIGANDVANNVGPAVGSKSITMLGAVILAATFEVVGAFVAGGDVTNTISKGIIGVDENMDSSIFIITMFSALFAAAFWLNLATWVGAPVSTTHSLSAVLWVQALCH